VTHGCVRVGSKDLEQIFSRSRWGQGSISYEAPPSPSSPPSRSRGLGASDGGPRAGADTRLDKYQTLLQGKRALVRENALPRWNPRFAATKAAYIFFNMKEGKLEFRVGPGVQVVRVLTDHPVTSEGANRGTPRRSGSLSASLSRCSKCKAPTPS